MTVPAVAFIEIALERLRGMSALEQARTLAELRGLGEARRAAVDDVAATDFERGYLIGLETARALLSTMPVAVVAGVTL